MKRDVVPGLVAGVCAAALIACAAGSSHQATSAPMAGAASEPGAGATPERLEIARLDAAIDAELGKRNQPPAPAPVCSGVGLGCAGAADTATSMGVTPKVQRDPTCKPGPSDTCQDTCTLSDSICSNAGKICSIAKQLGDADAWANEKCAKGTDTCKRAEQACCSCL